MVPDPTQQIVTNFGLSAFVLLVSLFVLWLISLKTRDASIIDIFWGFGFVLVALVCLFLAPEHTPYIMLLAALPILWGLRLTLYLAKRNLGHGEDYRYVAMRERSGLSEMAWRKRAFFSIFLGQGFLILIISAPIWVATATGLETDIGTLAIVGAVIWLTGFLFEAIGDAQLAAFKRKHADYDGPYADKPVLDTGLWKYTRHPNYFGNSLIWWGIWLVACAAPAGWVTVFSPIIMTILLVRVSGKDLLERKMKTRKAYADYVRRTSGFIPWFPKPKQN